ncbi:hypothetical protein XCR1_1130010 [Xenorhabdus cabanillasii JM26]|uniref:Uncharacterized protein n=1 Tax=Xenorhabdus cabanillasii JM26 TaxID=1427517 RepID=W1ILR4_9GAMM|nr:phage protein [Xenorhabdus cabanillasii JM26]CDL79422.1 hypothetical protein XCR1_1130010 [Xenorhabdus cabanillasii JM26]
MRGLKIYCPECDGQATIKKIKTEGLNNISEIYCCCNDVECGYTRFNHEFFTFDTSQ